MIETQTYSAKDAPFYVKILTLLYKLLGRKLLAQLFVTSGECKNCRICSMVCPNHAINFRFNTPHRNNQCKGCMLCVYFCPNQAIVLPLITIIGAILLIFLPYDEYVIKLFKLNFSSMSPLLYGIISLILWAICYAGVVVVFNKLSFLFSTMPVIKKMRGTFFIKRFYNTIHPVRIFPIIVPGEFMDHKVQNPEPAGRR